MGRYAVEEWVEARSSQERNEFRQTETNKKNDVTGKKVNKEEESKPTPPTKTPHDDVWSKVWKLKRQEIREAFLAINAVRWTQPVHLSGPLKGYTLVAHRSGHTLGGSIFTLRPSLSSSLSPASSASSLLYAPLFNHVKEHHLDPTALLSGGNVDDNMRRMGVVVVGAQRSKSINIKRIDRETKLLDLITKTLSPPNGQEGGSILMPTDPSARLFELLVLLESHWEFSNLTLKGFPLCLVSRTGKDAVQFVRSLTEWMGGQVGSDKGHDILKFSYSFPSLSLSLIGRRN
jgi:cleavage and polyadenylation specificity factor subunit 2